MQVTSPARTIADLARMLTFDQAIVAADGALYLELTTREKLMKAAEEMAAYREAGSPPRGAVCQQIE